MPLLELYERKWQTKTLAAVSKWVEMVKKPETFQSYVAGISAVTGLPESEVSASLPARNYREFQANAEQFAEKFRTRVQKAAEMRKWSRNYINAFRARPG